MILNITQFRARIKDAFDKVESEDVFINRDGKLYQLKEVSLKNLVQSVSNRIAEKFDVPEIKIEPVNEGLPCCKKQKKPCKHWQYNYQDSVWVNVLTNETREVNE